MERSCFESGFCLHPLTGVATFDVSFDVLFERGPIVFAHNQITGSFGTRVTGDWVIVIGNYDVFLKLCIIRYVGQILPFDKPVFSCPVRVFFVETFLSKSL